MALLSVDEEMQRSSPTAPFATDSYAMSWMSLWCEDGCRFELCCPLVAVALSGRTPQPWTESRPGSLDRYTCHEYQETT